MANAKHVANETGNFVLVHLDEIEVNPKWNIRSNLEETQRGPEEAASFEQFVKSLAEEGQDTPVIVRPNKDGSKKPYFLMTGNRRFEALRRIAEKGIAPKWATDSWCKRPTIKAEIRKLSDVAAFELNIRENTEREDLTAADLAFGIGRLCNAYRKENIKYTQTSVADKVGLSQAYTGKLMNIVDRCRQEIFENWRNAALKLTVDDMAKVAALPPADQQKAYDELLRAGSGSEKKGNGDPMKSAAKAAGNVGKLFGMLTREGALDFDFDSDWWLNHIQKMVKIKNRVGKNGGTKPPTEAQIAKIARVAEKAYAEALTENDESEETEETPKRKSKSRDAHADN